MAIDGLFLYNIQEKLNAYTHVKLVKYKISAMKKY